MSVADQITRLQNDSAAIAAAIEAKGVIVPSGSGYDDYAGLIANISGGGGAEFDDWRHDSDVHLWINIVDKAQLTQNLRIRLIGTIDWGDGSTKDTVNVTAYTTFTHTYTELGRYRIDLHKTSGTFYLGGASSSYNVMGSRTSLTMWRTSVLYQAECGSDLVTLSNYAFSYCYGLKKVYVSKSVTTLGSYAFTVCYGLCEVIFEDPTTITTATLTNTFNYCYALQHVTPLNIKAGTAMSATYRANYSMSEITIPSPVTSMASNSINSPNGLKHLWCLPTSAPTVSDDASLSGMPSGCVIHVPYGSLSSYQSAGKWSTYSSQMAEAGLVTYTLTNVMSSNKTGMVAANDSFATTLTPATGYTLGTVTVKMGGTDITNTAYSAGEVSIASVTGNIEITASGTSA